MIPTYDDFIKACKDGDIAAVNRALENEAIRAVAASHDNFGFRMAAFFGHLGVVNCLLEIEAVVANVCVNNNFALRNAFEKGYINIINRLAKIDEVKRRLKDDFIHDCIAGNINGVTRGLEIEAIRTDVELCTRGLQEAAGNGHLRVMNRLLEIEAVMNNAAAGNNTAFRYAVGMDRLDIVNRLFEIEAVRINAASNRNEALYCASQKGYLRIVNRLLEERVVRENATCMNNRAFLEACVHGHLPVVNRLLEIEAVRESAASSDNLALIRSAYHGHLHVVNRLLGIEAVFQKASTDENKALRNAVEEKHLDVAVRLLQINGVSTFFDLHQQDFKAKHQTFFDEVDKKIEEERYARVCAAKDPQALAFHNILCRKAECLKHAAQDVENRGLINCPKINLLRGVTLTVLPLDNILESTSNTTNRGILNQSQAQRQIAPTPSDRQQRDPDDDVDDKEVKRIKLGN